MSNSISILYFVTELYCFFSGSQTGLTAVVGTVLEELVDCLRLIFPPADITNPVVQEAFFDCIEEIADEI